MTSTDLAAKQPPIPSSALEGRARGAMVGSLLAFGWAYYAAAGLASPAGRILAVVVAAAISLSLVMASAALIRLARSLPPATTGQQQATRRAWRWFWLNLVAEIVLLNIAITLLAAPDRRIYWIPAISAVVGLHFWPMAAFFRARSYWWVGAAMMIVAAAVAMLVARSPGDATAWAHGEGLANALILWSAMVAVVAPALARPGHTRL